MVVRRNSMARAPTRFGASPFVQRFASKIAEAAGSAPILDVACGSGRNAFLLAEMGSEVICIDKDLSAIRENSEREREHLSSAAKSRIQTYPLDLIEQKWPFGKGMVGGIINVHFFLPTLLNVFARSLLPGAYLLIETIPGCGGNYLSLPRAGEVRKQLDSIFELTVYKESKVGPDSIDAVTVKVLAKRK